MPTTTVFPIGFGQIQYQWSLAGDPETITCGLDFEIEVPPFTQTNADAISADFATLWVANGINVYTFTGLEIRIAVDGGDPLEFTTSETAVGGGTGLALPQNCTFLFRKTTGVSGRRNRGRMYVPGVTEGGVDPVGVIQPTLITTMNQVASGLLTLPTVTDSNISELVILHSYQWEGAIDPGPPVGFPAPTAITNIFCDPTIATQRRRMR